MKRSRRIAAGAFLPRLLAEAFSPLPEQHFALLLFIWAHYSDSSVTGFVTLSSQIDQRPSVAPCDRPTQQMTGKIQHPAKIKAQVSGRKHPSASASSHAGVFCFFVFAFFAGVFFDVGEVNDLRLFGDVRLPDNPACASACARSYLQTAKRSRAAAYPLSHFGGSRRYIR